MEPSQATAKKNSEYKTRLTFEKENKVLQKDNKELSHIVSKYTSKNIVLEEKYKELKRLANVAFVLMIVILGLFVVTSLLYLKCKGT